MGDGRPSSALRCRNRCLLALDIRAQKLGFVVFDGPTRLLGSGNRRYGGTKQRPRGAVVKRISSLLDFYEPSILVIRKTHIHSPKTSRQVGNIIDTIRIEAKRRSVDVQILSAKTVKKFFAQSGPTAKHEIASTLAGRFEDLAWKLPKKRKAWQSERHNIVIFDAAATGVAFFGSKDPIKKVSGE
jgi:hypothetical protein